METINEIAHTLENIQNAPGVNMTVKPYPYNIVFDELSYETDFPLGQTVTIHLKANAKNTADPTQPKTLIEGRIQFNVYAVQQPMDDHIIESLLTVVHETLLEHNHTRRLRGKMQTIADKIVKNHPVNQTNRPI